MKTHNYLLNSLTCSAKRIYVIAVTLMLVLSGTIVMAQPGTPGFFNNFVNSTSTNFFPLGSSTNRVQWIYGPSVFASGGTGVGTPAFNGMITKVYIKMGATVSALSTYSNFTISLSQNVGTATTISSTAWTTPMTVCLLSPTKQLTGVLANQWYGFTLTTPFLYDPSQSLMMELKVSSTSGSNTMGQNLAGGSTRRWGTFSGGSASSFGSGLVGLGFDLVSATPCSGTPAPGNTVASANPICPGTSLTLSPQNISSLGSGNTFQWETSPDNIAWSNAAGSSTFLTYTTTQTVATWYRVVVTCTNSGLSGTSTPVQVNMNPIYNCYCPAAGATSTADEEISNVTFGSMNNSSNCTTLGPGPGSILRRYSNYMGFVTPPTAMQGAAIPFSVTQTTCGGIFGNRTFIWIDYNQNGSWLDAGENVFAGPTVSGNHTDAGNITIPLTATPGLTGMRVLNVEGSVSSPCAAFTWGEIEDYLINVAAAVPCSGAPVAGTVTAPVGTLCPSANVTLSAAGATSGLGIVYQWESSTTGCAGTFNPIAGANNTSYTFLPSLTTTSYRMKITCTNSGLFDYTNCVDVTATLLLSCYCTSNATSTADEEITNVIVGSLSNASACGVVAPGPGSLVNRYSNWTTTVPAAALPKGASVPFSVTQTSCGGAFTNRTAIFIDLNRDGDLTDAGENVFFGPSFVGNHTDAGSIFIPATASEGITLMRIKNVETGGTFTPCGTFTWGEVEDYFVNVIVPPPFPPACATYNSPADLAADICPATGITLSWSSGTVGGAFGIPASYDVYFGTSPSPPLVTNTASTSYVTGPLTPGQTYYWQVVPKNSYGDATGCSGPRSFTAATSVAFATGCYCQPVYTNTFNSNFQCPVGNGCTDNDGIINVTFNGVSFSSLCACPNAYSFTASPVIPLTQGGTYPLTVTPTGVFTEGIRAWIDYNDNGSFEDAGEAIMNALSAAPVTVNVFVPCSAPVGMHRLRVRTVFSVTGYTSCSQQVYGETEDYIVNIVANTVIATVGTATVTPAVGCGFQNVPLSSTVDTYTGLIQWQFEQPFGANNWVDIPGVVTQTANLVANMPQGSGTITFGLRAKVFDCFNNIVFSNSAQFTLDDPTAPTAVSGAERCGPGDVTLLATPALGHSIEWWSAASGGSLVGTGSSFVYNATATTTLFAANRNPVTGCLGTLRVAATATVHTIPVTVASNNGPLCAPASEGATATAQLNATGSAPPVPGSVLTTLTGTNSQNGNMFEITAVNALTITSIDQRLNTGFSHSYNIYYKTGSYVGFTNTPGAWTLLGTASGITSLGSGVATPIPIPLALNVGAGQTISFYLTCTNNPGFGTVAYSNGTAQGSVFASDANLQIKQGIGKQWDPTLNFNGANFGVAPASRIWNGRINYTVGVPLAFTWLPVVSCSNADCSQGTATLFPSATPYQFTVTITNTTTGCSSTASTDVVVNKFPNMTTLQSATLNGGVASVFPVPPTFLDIPVFTESLTCDKVVNYVINDLGIPAPTYTHGMTGATIVPSGTSGTGSGTNFTRLIPTGRSNITVVSSNVCGTNTRTFRVTVTDNVAPVITPIPVPVSNTNGGDCASLVQVTQPDLSNGGLFDNCPNASLIFVSRSDNRTQFEPYYAGTTTVTWLATDASSNTTVATQDVEVVNIKPVITSFVSNAGNLIFVGETTTFTTTFTDEDGGGTHTVKFYRDKNDATPANVKTLAYACYNSCTGITTYTATSDPILFSTSSVSEPKVEILDGCNLAADQEPGISTIQYLAIAVAGQQFTTAGGHFTMPAGSLPSAYEGFNVSIGNVVKKATNGNSFKGQLEMNVHIPNQPDWRVHTDNGSNTDITWDYLTIGGCSLATFKGACRLNGATGYKVLVQQADKDRNPATSNFIRVKVTTNSGTVVFDTQPGLTEALTSGNGGAAAIIAALDGGAIKVQPSNTQNQACTSRIDASSAQEDVLQNLPNPFNGQTEIRFTVPEDGLYTLKVYNYVGQEVIVLFNGEAVSGSVYEVTFDGTDLPQGIYTYTLTGANLSETRKMNLVK